MRVERRPLSISTLLKTIITVMLWHVHFQKVPQASKHLYTAKLSTSYACCACERYLPVDSL